jgi:hypothetical protein
MPINISDQPLPKYRYASIESLYPVQVYIELPTFINGISPGLYHHNSDKHTLELINASIKNESIDIRLHLVGRSSAIAPLYGKTLGTQFCILETGYMMGLLEKEASRLGLKFSKINYNDLIEHILDLDRNDTHYCFTTSFNKQHMSNGNFNSDNQCIVYLKTVRNNKHWFVYDNEDETIIPLDIGEETTKDDIPLFFDNDDTKIIFHDCQGVIFLVNRFIHTLDIGRMSHLLMNDCLEMNIGMCPIGTRISLPRKINVTLDKILAHYRLTGNNLLLHTLLIGKISDDQKYEKATSKVKHMPDWSGTLRANLSRKLPAYMVPSHFVTVSSFPLSANGKIDRNSLPEVSMSVFGKDKTCIAPNTELEKTIANIWQQFLCTDRTALNDTDSKSNLVSSIRNETIHLTDHTASNFSCENPKVSYLISTTTSFFDLGGDSLLLIQIYQYYQSLFNFDTEALTIGPFFIKNTLAEHAKLLETFLINNMKSLQWHTLHINEGNN